MWCGVWIGVERAAYYGTQKNAWKWNNLKIILAGEL